MARSSAREVPPAVPIWPDGAGVLYDRSVFAKLTVRKNGKTATFPEL